MLNQQMKKQSSSIWNLLKIDKRVRITKWPQMDWFCFNISFNSVLHNCPHGPVACSTFVCEMSDWSLIVHMSASWLISFQRLRRSLPQWVWKYVWKKIGKLSNCGAATAVTMSGLQAKVALTLFSELSKRCIVVLSLVQIVVPCYSYVHQQTSTVAFL